MFISYTYSDDCVRANSKLQRLIRHLRLCEFDVFCNIEHDQMYKDVGWPVKQIMTHALFELAQCNVVVVFAEERMSQGMLIEFGHAHHIGLPILLLISSCVHATSSRDLSSDEIIYDSDDSFDELMRFKPSQIRTCQEGVDLYGSWDSWAEPIKGMNRPICNGSIKSAIVFTLPSLPPGEYQFNQRPSHNDAVGVSCAKPVMLVIKPEYVSLVAKAITQLFG